MKRNICSDLTQAKGQTLNRENISLYAHLFFQNKQHNIMKKYKFPLQIVGKSMGRKQTLHINIIVQMVDMFYSGSDTKKINSLETNRYFDNLMGF